jgi:hypothetical protein
VAHCLSATCREKLCWAKIVDWPAFMPLAL